MSVLIETNVGELVIDLHVKDSKRACLNFVKLCKIKAYNYSLLYSIQQDFIAQVGQPNAENKGLGISVWGHLKDATAKTHLFSPEIRSSLKHDKAGVVSFTTSFFDNVPYAGSEFMITLVDKNMDWLDGKHVIFGQVVEGLDMLEKFNTTLCDEKNRPFKDIIIKHTIILDDPFEDPVNLVVPLKSPELTKKLLANFRLSQEDCDVEPIDEKQAEKLAQQAEIKARALTLEMVGDLPFAEIKPPENVLFVAKLNPITRDQDLEIIFGRFGNILSCEVIRDKLTSESLGYAFIEYENKQDCEEAYTKMDKVLIDDRRIHVDFSQSVAKFKQPLKKMNTHSPKTHDYGFVFENRDRKSENMRGGRKGGRDDDRRRDDRGHDRDDDRRRDDRRHGRDDDRRRDDRRHGRDDDRRRDNRNDRDDDRRKDEQS